MTDYTRVQREQATEVLEKFQTGIYGHGGKIGVAIDTAIAALRGPQLDPDTGLVPCGCGGEAMIHECHNLSYVIYCDKCKIETNYQLTADTAKDAWNTAMGYKEQ